MVLRELTEEAIYLGITQRGARNTHQDINHRIPRNIHQDINHHSSRRMYKTTMPTDKAKDKEMVQRKREEGEEDAREKAAVVTKVVSNRNSEIVFIAF